MKKRKTQTKPVQNIVAVHIGATADAMLEIHKTLEMVLISPSHAHSACRPATTADTASIVCQECALKSSRSGGESWCRSGSVTTWETALLDSGGAIS